jgi:hypothetical protein
MLYYLGPHLDPNIHLWVPGMRRMVAATIEREPPQEWMPAEGPPGTSKAFKDEGRGYVGVSFNVAAHKSAPDTRRFAAFLTREMMSNPDDLLLHARDQFAEVWPNLPKIQAPPPCVLITAIAPSRGRSPSSTSPTAPASAPAKRSPKSSA